MLSAKGLSPALLTTRPWSRAIKRADATIPKIVHEVVFDNASLLANNDGHASDGLSNK